MSIYCPVDGAGMKVKSDCIVAIATAVGRGALSVIRMSGPKTLEVFEKCVRQKEKFREYGARSISLYHLCDPETGNLIDEVTAIKYMGPSSYTGEDMVEIISHGGVVCGREIISAIVSAGSRVADRGEFTLRAMASGKMSLLKAESMHEVISSESGLGKKRALQNYFGGWERSVSGWRTALEEGLIYLESRIEFGEEDDVANAGEDKGLESIDFLAVELGMELKIRESIEEREKGLTVVFGGLRNAGKSSLFNCLLGYNRAIVDSSYGTTRDAISEEIVVEGVRVSIVDTAGLGESGDRIELQGMERSEAYLADADIVFWVSAADEKWDEKEKGIVESYVAEGRKVVGVINKGDLGSAEEKIEIFARLGTESCVTSTVLGDARDKLSMFLVERVQKNSTALEEGVVVSNRQEGIVARLLEKTSKVLESRDREDVAAEYCREAIEILGEFTGDTIGEKMLDEIFGRFCIGK